ncbi:MAG: DUF4410 domain-containing protein [Thermoanaerobaculia bacterium]|nr:DUF4410 domain-containing protein [Thermoanaerobaculia bacterium]
MKLTRPLTMLLGATLLLTATTAEAKKDRPVSGTLDDGRLVVSWFSDEPLAFREADEIDYLWVRDGFTIEGQSFHLLPWPDPEIPGDRDAKDRRLAKEMNEDMADLFADIFADEWPASEVSTEGGDIKVEGRIVDCSTGSAAAKFWVGMGAGSGNTTIDVKFTDGATGELLAAIHHRVVSGTSWSTTDSKFLNWVAEIAEEIHKKGLDKMYAKGGGIDD